MDIGIAGIAKDYGVYPALHGVDLDIRGGELIALLGPSGSGKTTLLRVIAGLEVPDKGSVLFGGQDAAGFSVQDRRVGFVFQSYALFRHMTVFRNIAYGLHVRPSHLRPGKAEIRSRVMALLDLVQLSGFENRYPAQLSGGQRQRVALARALAIEPRVLLLDEPFGALDARVRKELRRWLRDVHRRTGLTTVFVTHDQDEAMELADRVAVLNKGRIEQVGTPSEIYDAPASPFVLSFTGEAVSVEVVTSGGVSRVGGRPVDLPGANMRDGRSQLYVRPRDARITAPEDGTLVGTVAAIRRTSAGHGVEIAVDAVAQPIEIVVERLEVGLGERVGLAVPKSMLFSDERQPA